MWLRGKTYGASSEGEALEAVASAALEAVASAATATASSIIVAMSVGV